MLNRPGQPPVRYGGYPTTVVCRAYFTVCLVWYTVCAITYTRTMYVIGNNVYWYVVTCTPHTALGMPYLVYHSSCIKCSCLAYRVILDARQMREFFKPHMQIFARLVGQSFGTWAVDDKDKQVRLMVEGVYCAAPVPNNISKCS